MAVLVTEKAATRRGSDEALLLAEGRRRRRVVSIQVWAIRLIGGVVVLGAWEVATRIGLLNRFFFSHPAGIAVYLFNQFAGGNIWPDLIATAYAAILGFAIGSALGIAAGAMWQWLPIFGRAMDPFVTVFNALPRPALAPIFLLWFGLGATPKVVVAVTVVFFIMLLNTRAGLARANPDALMLTTTLGMTPFQQFMKVRLPYAMPAIVAGLRLSAVFSVLGVVVSEMVAAREGLGQLMVQNTGRFNIDGTFGVMVLLAALATAFDLAVGVIQRAVAWGDET